MNKLVFPQGFLWGSATSAHQIEGNNTNSDWWRWEHSEIREIELRNQNKNPENYYSGIACDSYNRYKQDFDIAQKLNQNAHRLSIEWARIEPEKGKFNPQEIDHYRAVLADLKQRGIKTFVTLHHFTNPVWFAEIGGWERHENVKYFFEYAQKVIEELHNSIDFLCVINESNVYAGQGYVLGIWPPQKKNFFLAHAVQKNMALAHREVYKYVKSKRINIQVGTAHSVHDEHPRGVLKLLRHIFEYFEYESYLRAVCNHADFIGINYYTRRRVEFIWSYPFFRWYPPEFELTDMGWEIYPQGFYRVLVELKKYKKPIYITENGIADHSDSKREFFIREHLKAANRAIAEGVDLRGYLHWSLIDNFEWADGFGPRFGLVEIDRENNLERKIRPSAYVYAEICKNNAIEVGA